MKEDCRAGTAFGFELGRGRRERGVLGAVDEDAASMAGFPLQNWRYFWFVVRFGRFDWPGLAWFGSG